MFLLPSPTACLYAPLSPSPSVSCFSYFLHLSLSLVLSLSTSPPKFLLLSLTCPFPSYFPSPRLASRPVAPSPTSHLSNPPHNSTLRRTSPRSVHLSPFLSRLPFGLVIRLFPPPSVYLSVYPSSSRVRSDPPIIRSALRARRKPRLGSSQARVGSTAGGQASLGARDRLDPPRNDINYYKPFTEQDGENKRGMGDDRCCGKGYRMVRGLTPGTRSSVYFLSLTPARVSWKSYL